jgi:hypothetical protein
MPFESEAQRRFMYAKHPGIAKRWEKHTPDKKLPEKKKSEKKAALLVLHEKLTKVEKSASLAVIHEKLAAHLANDLEKQAALPALAAAIPWLLRGAGSLLGRGGAWAAGQAGKLLPSGVGKALGGAGQAAQQGLRRGGVGFTRWWQGKGPVGGVAQAAGQAAPSAAGGIAKDIATQGAVMGGMNVLTPGQAAPAAPADPMAQYNASMGIAASSLFNDVHVMAHVNRLVSLHKG